MQDKENLGFRIGHTCVEKLKSWSFRNIRGLALSIQDEIKCDSEHQIKREKLGKRRIQVARTG